MINIIITLGGGLLVNDKMLKLLGITAENTLSFKHLSLVYLFYAKKRYPKPSCCTKIPSCT